jgi:hypothetical protein
MSAENDRDPAAQRAFEQQTRADLRRRVAQTSPEVRARLDDMVAAAVREKPVAPANRAWRLALPVGGSAAAAVLVALLVLREPQTPIEKPAATAADDVALLLNVDNLDLLEQMEFYLWLDREPGLLPEAAAASSVPQRS